MLHDTDADTLRFKAVKQETLALIAECVGPLSHSDVGGVTTVGARQLLYITVSGYESPGARAEFCRDYVVYALRRY